MKFLLPIVAMMIGFGSMASAAALENVPKLQIQYNDYSGNDYGYFYYTTGEPEDEFGNLCEWTGQPFADGENNDCTLRPGETPETRPAGDACMYFIYYDDWSIMSGGVACMKVKAPVKTPAPKTTTKTATKAK